MKNAVEMDLNDLVFEGRNKQYGAYVIRRSYDKNLSEAVLLTLAIALLLLLIPIVASYFKESGPIIPLNPGNNKITEFSQPPVIPDPPSLIQPQHTIAPEDFKFTPPDITKLPTDAGILDQIKTPIIPDMTGAGFTTGTGTGTGTAEIKNPVTEPKIEEFADIEAEPTGGMAAYLKYLQDHIGYPRVALDNNIQGTLMLSLVINTDGSIRKIDVVKPLGGGFEEEAERAILAGPKWKPAEINHHAVPFKLILPLKFYINN